MKWPALKHRLESAIANSESDFHGYTFNEALSILVRERFMARAAHSSVKDMVILKGGLLLTAVYTKQSRFTIDADLTIKSASDLASYQKAVDAIIDIDLDDGFRFSRNKGEFLEAEVRLYDGATFQITATFATNQKLVFTLDFGVGDSVDPVKNKLPVLPETNFDSVEMYVYPAETIAAEKLQTCVEKGEANSRLKDYYDLYLLRDIVDSGKFKSTAMKTYKQRGTEFPGRLPEPRTLQALWTQFLKSQKLRVMKAVPQDLAEVMAAIQKFYGVG